MNYKKLNEQVYLIGIVIATVKLILASSTEFNVLQSIDTIIIVFYLTCMLYKCVMQTYTQRTLIAFILTGLVTITCCLKAKNFYLLFTFFAIAASQDIDIKKTVKAMFTTKAIIIAFHVLAYFVVLKVNPSAISFVYRNGIQRHTFFFGHANTFTTYLIWVCLEYVYIKYDEINWKQLTCVWLINAAFYHFTDSNTGFYVMTVATVLIILDKYKVTWVSKMLYGISKYGYIFTALLCYWVMAFYASSSTMIQKAIMAVNTGLTGRLAYGIYTYQTYGITMFGRQITFPAKVNWNGYYMDGIIFDNSYMWLYCLYGTAAIIVISIALFWVAKRTTNIERILIVAFIFYGIMESYIVNVVACFPMLFLGKYIFEADNEYRLKISKNKYKR